MCCPWPWSWSSKASNSSSVISPDSPATVAPGALLAGVPPTPCSSSSRRSNSSAEISSMEPPPLTAAGSLAWFIGSTTSGSETTSTTEVTASGSMPLAPLVAVRSCSSPSGLHNSWRSWSKSSDAGLGASRFCTWANITFMASSACRITSISSAVTVRLPLRKISNTFSAP